MRFKVAEEDIHPLANPEYSEYEGYKYLRESLHQWPLGVLDMNEDNIDEYCEKYYSMEDHPFYKLVCTRFEVPPKYGTTQEESKKLFVDCFKDEVFSTAFLGRLPPKTANFDIFYGKRTQIYVLFIEIRVYSKYTCYNTYFNALLPKLQCYR